MGIKVRCQLTCIIHKPRRQATLVVWKMLSIFFIHISATWHQYDDVMQLEVKNSDKNVGGWKNMFMSTVTSVKSKFGFGSQSSEVTRLVHDRELAALTFLPKWEGFVVTKSPAKMDAVEAIRMVGQVCGSVMHPEVTCNRNSGKHSHPPIWKLEGFDRNTVSQI